MDFNEVKVNAELGEKGVWINHDGTTSFKIARLNNRNFQTKFNKLMQPYRRQFDAGKLSNDKQVDIMCKAMAETVLLGWKGLTDGGEPVEYSVEKAYEYLSMEGADEFRDLITAYAQDAETYREEYIETDVKN